MKTSTSAGVDLMPYNLRMGSSELKKSVLHGRSLRNNNKATVPPNLKNAGSKISCFCPASPPRGGGVGGGGGGQAE